MAPDPTDPAAEDEAAVLEALEGRLAADELEELDRLAGSVTLRSRPVTHVRVDGLQTTVYGSHLSAAEEAYYEQIYRDALRRHGGLPG